jgi:CheY-like chemotaxis protein
VVDDNRDAAELLAEALTALGHLTRAAFDPLSVLEIATQFAPDFALLDIGLPGMDGYELAQRMRRIPQLAAMRLFAVTGYGQTADRAQSLEAGFEQHLTKPLDRDTLDSLIRTDAKPSTT